MSNFVEDGFKIVNVDDSQLNELRRSNNTLDTGAIKILESLDLFCEDLIDSCDYVSQSNYQKLFNSLRTVIKSAYENEKIRNAVMTGIIRDTPKAEVVTVKKETVKTSSPNKKKLNKAEVCEYVKNHNLYEAAEYFGVTKAQISNFVNYHGIKYTPCKAGRKGSLDKAKILEVSSEMTIGELAALFNVGYEAMKAYCRRNQIPHK
jgi:predicted house-cleaning noncanonical NTP pyrophosphatase (MazG superfamily)